MSEPLITNWTRLEVEKSGRKYYLFCSPDSPLGELHDAVYDLKKMIVDRILTQQSYDQQILKNKEENSSDDLSSIT